MLCNDLEEFYSRRQASISLDSVSGGEAMPRLRQVAPPPPPPPPPPRPPSPPPVVWTDDEWAEWYASWSPRARGGCWEGGAVGSERGGDAWSSGGGASASYTDELSSSSSDESDGIADDVGFDFGTVGHAVISADGADANIFVRMTSLEQFSGRHARRVQVFRHSVVAGHCRGM